MSCFIFSMNLTRAQYFVLLMQSWRVESIQKFRAGIVSILQEPCARGELEDLQKLLIALFVCSFLVSHSIRSGNKVSSEGFLYYLVDTHGHLLDKDLSTLALFYTFFSSFRWRPPSDILTISSFPIYYNQI